MKTEKYVFETKNAFIEKILLLIGLRIILILKSFFPEKGTNFKQCGLVLLHYYFW